MREVPFVFREDEFTANTFALAPHVIDAIFPTARFLVIFTFPATSISPVVFTSPTPFTVNGVVVPIPAVHFMKLKSVASDLLARKFIIDERNVVVVPEVISMQF
jgi:hypothetical protein